MVDHDALFRELLETFRLEAQEHLDHLGLLLVALEREEEPALRGQQVEGIFRRMHTLKGAAHAVNLVDVAGICQELESILSELKRGTLELDRPLFDRLHRDINQLSARIFGGTGAAELGGATTEEARNPAEPPAGRAPDQAKAQQALEDAPGVSPDTRPGGAKASRKPAAAAPADSAAPATPATPATPGIPASSASASASAAASAARPPGAELPERRDAAPEKSAAFETVRVPTRLLESLLLQAEELVSAKLAASALIEELSVLAGELGDRAAARSRAQELAGAAFRAPGSDLVATRLASVVQEFCETERRGEVRLRALEHRAERNLHSLNSLVDPLLEEMKKLHLLPFSTLADPFSKVIRDLARELGKEAELQLSGCELEIDRRILAELKEPLLHIVRNMMDHGIEPAAQRAGRGKPPRGRIAIDLRLKDANHAELRIGDDGAGIDPEKVKGTALRLELITAEAAGRMGDAEALQLIFESGFSTSPMITALSGRGVGLAIVREALERLGGHVSVESHPGAGTEFRLTLPLSFALIRGLLVETGGRSCILPAGSVAFTSRLPQDAVRTVEGRDTVLLGGEVFSLVSLASVLGLGERPLGENEANRQVVLLSAGERRVAFAVDQVVGVQEALVKPLGSQLSRVRNVAGATVLGNGRVVPVLNINDLMRSALSGPARPLLRETAGERSRRRRLSVLVAEDSITSRTLLKNILEASGFQVATAVDGADALAQLKTGDFDLVVSDVEMPRMDGFALTGAIRADSRLAETPVVLVTGLESREDREKGIEVGASAYVVKSSFDQGSLVEVIQKLTGA